MNRVILHADMNCFFASVEMLHHPELRDVPMAVGGDAEARHGIILTKNRLAKIAGVQTGEALWQAKKKCPNLVIVPPHYEDYLRFSRLARRIYCSYTDRVESFGMDECWLDVSGAGTDGKKLADEIRGRILRELGLTVSVGVADNKIFAKLGSDMKKPDATTVITPENFKTLVWPLPVGDLLFAGPATVRKLKEHGVHTIGDLAKLPPGLPHAFLGKAGEMLHMYANGLDTSPVAHSTAREAVFTVGNGVTAPRDLLTDEDAKVVFSGLCEEVASRLRSHGFFCRTVQITVRGADLVSYQRQQRIDRPTMLSCELCDAAMSLFLKSHTPGAPVRSLGVRACSLTEYPIHSQLDLFGSEEARLRLETLEHTVDGLRSRFGKRSIMKAVQMLDPTLANLAGNTASDSITSPDCEYTRGITGESWYDHPY